MIMCFEMKRVAILTRTSTMNFGTILQNYALQKVVESLGFDVLTVDDSVPRGLYSHTDDDFHNNDFISPKGFIYGLYDRVKDSSKNRRYYKTGVLSRRFKKRNIKYYKVSTLEALKEDFDIFISGSDQIWSDKAEPQMFPFFMQDFVPEDKMRLSYAVSVGAYFYQCNEEVVRQNLRRMDSVSVREPSSFRIVRNYYDGEIRTDCDPVLLIDTEKWKYLSGKRKIKGKYIFCYLLSNNEWYYGKICDYARSLGLEEVYLYESHDSEFKECHKIQSCSPGDFLNYILFADFVITDSFHASLFSILFNKQFVVFQRYSDEVNVHQNGMISSVLNNTGLVSRYLEPDMPVIKEQIDYCIINSIIQQMRQRSIIYIETRLKKGRMYNGKEVDDYN